MAGRIAAQALLGVAGLAMGLAAASPAKAQLGASLGEHPEPVATAEFDVYLPLRNASALEVLIDELHRPGSALYHQWLSPQEFAIRFGASAATIGRVRAELIRQGLAVTVNGSHSLHVNGSVAAVERALGTRLARGMFPDGHAALVAETELSLPPALLEAGAMVPHFTKTIHVHSHALLARTPLTDNRNSTTGKYWFDDLKQAYSYPSIAVANGAGVKIGILMSGDINPPDMTQYFGHEKIAVPQITSTPVGGGAPFDPNGNSVESTLDVQQSGGMAPGAAITLFNIPDLTDASILAGLTTIIENNATDLVNMSFGGPELGYTAPYNDGIDYTSFLTIYNTLFMQGVSQGITFVASSGDGGALPLPQPACFAANARAGCGVFVRSVDIPASSPNVVSVGGTDLVTDHTAGSFDSAYVSETANYDPLASDFFFNTPAAGGIWGSGGGLSVAFAQPSYQLGIGTASRTARMVPDVAMHMGGCPADAVEPCGPNRSADAMVVGGSVMAVIGTSAAAPDFLGLLALKVQLTHGRLGNENYHIYAAARAQAAGAKPVVFRNAIVGNNGYKTTQGYNLVLGNGTVYGAAYLGVSNLPLAGVPQTASNP